MKDNFKEILVTLGLSVGLAFGFSDLLPFWKGFAITLPVFSTICYVYIEVYKRILDEKTKLSDEIVNEYEKISSGKDEIIQEKDQVIKEYEAILDTQYVSIECDCKKGVFEGFFEKTGETTVKCEHCGNMYRIQPKFDFILVAEPLNNDKVFEELTEKVEKETGEDIKD